MDAEEHHPFVGWDKMNIKQKKFLDVFASLLAKMAKADGRVTEDEVSKVDAIWCIMGLSNDQAGFCSAIFRFAQDDDISIEEYVNEFINTEFGIETRGFLYNLMWDVACSDGVLHESEKSILKSLPRELGINEDLYDAYYSQYISIGEKAKDREIENLKLKEELSKIRKQVEKTSQDARSAGAPSGVETLWGEAVSAFASAEKACENEDLIEAKGYYEKSVRFFKECIDNIHHIKQQEEDEALRKRREALSVQHCARDLGAQSYESNDWQHGAKNLQEGDVLSSQRKYSLAIQKYVAAIAIFNTCIAKAKERLAIERKRREEIEKNKRRAEEMFQKAESARRRAECTNGSQTCTDAWTVAILAMAAGDREFVCGNYRQALCDYEIALNLFEKCISSSSGHQVGEKVRWAYSMLGCKQEDNIGIVRKRYLLLVKQWHPDRLAADGAPKEMISRATRKMAEINEAWDMICKANDVA